MTAAGFAHALLDRDARCPPGLRTHNGSDPGVRFAVYRNNVVASLVAALADAFPVVRALVGDEFFTAMAGGFVAAQPPASPVLSDWGDGFAAYVRGFAPAAALPYLADVARLERARVRAFHAADAPSLPADALAAQLQRPAALPGARLALHPSVQLLQSDHAIVSLWAAHQGAGAIERVDPFEPEAALVLRADDDVAVIALPPATAVFVHHLQRGATLAAAAAEAAGAPTREPFALDAALALLIRHGAVSAWQAAAEGLA